MTQEYKQPILERLRGIVKVPITDGLGPVVDGGNADFFERHFPTSKCAMEAAGVIEDLLEALKLYMEVGDQCSRGYLAKCEESARAAISKATGEMI